MEKVQVVPLHQTISVYCPAGRGLLLFLSLLLYECAWLYRPGHSDHGIYSCIWRTDGILQVIAGYHTGNRYDKKEIKIREKGRLII